MQNYLFKKTNIDLKPATYSFKDLPAGAAHTRVIQPSRASLH